MKIVVIDGYSLNPGDLSWDGLKALGKVVIYDRSTPEEAIERIQDADIVLVNKIHLGKDELCGSKVKYIGVLATGYDVVDTSYCTDKGIIVTNIPAYGTYSVAQHTFSHILNIFSNVSIHSDSVKSDEWANNEWSYWKTELTELYGKTLGIIGYGRIGKAVGDIAAAFGMNILTSSSNKNDEVNISLDLLLAKSDIISLHCPLTPETKEIINKDNIKKMKDGAVIINTSRGGLVNEHDLADALNSGKIKAAGLDVVSREPINSDNPLLFSKNTYITPHMAWASKEARNRLMAIAIENVKSYLMNQPINVVN